jgi:hypothetical protein
MSAGAAAAAAAEAERMRQEEEEMSGYSGKDLAEGWEFKIMRSPMGSFRRPEKLRDVLEQERRGGWTFVEKFDDSRIRLKRPAGGKPVDGDFADGYDPYRTNIGPPPAQIVAVVLGITLAAFTGLILVAVLLAR